MATTNVDILIAAKNTADAALKQAQEDVAGLSAALQEQLKAQQELNTALANAKGPQQFYEAEQQLARVGTDIAVTQQQQATATTALAAAQRQADSASQKLAGTHQNLFTTFTAANLAAQAITKGLSSLKDEVESSIQAANNYQQSMAGLASYATAFGVSSQDATRAVQQLSSDGLLPLSTSATALKNLLSTGIGLDQSVQLLQTFKDRAAFGRAETVDFGTAVQNLSEFFKTGRSQLGDLNGVTTNYNQLVAEGAAQMGLNANTLDQAQTYQAAYLGLLQDSLPAQGDAARYAQTAAGAQSQYNFQLQQAQITLGTALQPAVTLFEQSLTGLLQQTNVSGDGMKNLQGDFVTLAAVVAQAANLIIGAVEVIGGGLISIFTFNPQVAIDAVNDAGKRIVATSVNWQQQLNNIAAGGNQDQQDAYNKNLAAMDAAHQQAIQKRDEQIAKENQSFADAMQQRARSFQMSMEDMIIAHRDKAASIQADLAKEDAAYAKSTAEKQQQLNADLANLNDQHAKKVTDINKQISDENKKTIDIDGRRYSLANQQKLADLQQNLDEENAAYQKSVDTTNAKYQEDVANAKAAHDQKMADLQQQLNAETAILQQHAAEVAAVGNKQKDDDITRLQQQYAYENQQAAVQHVQRLADIQNQGTQEGAAYVAAKNDAITQQQLASQGGLNGLFSDAGNQMADAMWQSFKTELKHTLGEGLRDLGSSASTVVGAVLRGAANVSPLGVIGNSIISFLDHRATGGPVIGGQPYIVNEQGPELFVPDQNGTIIPHTQTQQLLQRQAAPTINIGTVINHTPFDWTAQLRTWAIQLR